jgi:ASC-1-like (ASCH) protein
MKIDWILFIILLVLLALIMQKNASSAGSASQVGGFDGKQAILRSSTFTEGQNIVKISGNNLTVRDPWLYYIQIGLKTIEGRRGDKNKFKNWIGETLTLWNSKRVVPTKVTDVRWYPTLAAYLDGEDLSKLAPHLKTRADVEKAYYDIWSDDEIKKSGGMCAIVVDNSL